MTIRIHRTSGLDQLSRRSNLSACKPWYLRNTRPQVSASSLFDLRPMGRRKKPTLPKIKWLEVER